MRQQPPTKLPSADEILYRILEIAHAHFTRMPFMVTTNRRGRYESGWIMNRDVLVPLGNKSLPLADRQRNEQRLTDCIAAYIAHPKAKAELLTRNPLFPKSVELRLATAPGH